MYIKRLFGLVLFISFLTPTYLNAQIKITEIMYDPEGSDTKREWIEVFNSGTTSVDLSTYFLLENNTYHKLVAQAGSILSAGGFAIIVDSIAEVVAEYKDYMGLIFDSTFSLNNTGETVSIANSNKEIIDTVVYDNSIGANNDGNSLQINDGKIITANPTFGRINSTESETVPLEDESNSTTDESSTNNNSEVSTNSGTISSHIQQESLSKYNPPATFKISAGRNRTVTINTPIDFYAYISKTEIKPRFFWNFGDFETKKGSKVEHTYVYPGIYEVVLEGKGQGDTEVSRTEVSVVIPELEVSFSSSTFSLANLSKKEVNLGGFVLEMKDLNSFEIPQNTIIKGGARINKKMPEESEPVQFVYPNGEIYYRFGTI